MTYEAYENSVDGGAPVELYIFRVGLSAFYFTSADENYSYDGETYLAEPIKRSRLDYTSEVNKQNIDIEVTRSNEIAKFFRFSPPDTVVSLTLLRLHRDDPDQDAITTWVGRVLSVRWKETTASLYCEPVSTSVRRIGPRRNYQRNCPHVLYKEGCNVNRTLYRYTGQVSSVTGLVAVVPGTQDKDYKGGYLTWVDADGVVNARTIEAQSADALTLMTSSYGLNPGQDVEVYPGCAHTISVCSSVFNNQDNYGGTTMYLPVSDPFKDKVF